MGYEVPPYPGIVDYSDDPILPPWYIPGWTNQNENNVLAPVSPFQLTELPLTLTRIEVTGNWTDGIGNAQGGYLTFESSNSFQVTDTEGNIYVVPKGLVGDIPVDNVLAWNQEGSGKIHLIYGQLDVVLLANDNMEITQLFDPVDKYSITGAKSKVPDQWTYHVREYWLNGCQYDIFVPSTNSPVDIHTLIVPGTVYLNEEWARGY